MKQIQNHSESCHYFPKEFFFSNVLAYKSLYLASLSFSAATTLCGADETNLSLESFFSTLSTYLASLSSSFSSLANSASILTKPSSGIFSSIPSAI